jgi:YggT family protein
MGITGFRFASKACKPQRNHSPVDSFLSAFDLGLLFLRRALFVVVVIIAIICLIDWLVRTRRINPFNPIARFMRSTVDPIMAPVERRIVRAGGMPSAAPWWTLVFAVIGTIILLWALGFIRDQMRLFYGAGTAGPRDVLILIVHWTFWILQIAIIVRVISSWVQVSPYSPWVRWAFQLSEPILRPLRQIVPTIGVIDITPIVAYFLLAILRSVVMRLLAGL